MTDKVHVHFFPDHKRINRLHATALNENRLFDERKRWREERARMEARARSKPQLIIEQVENAAEKVAQNFGSPKVVIQNGITYDLRTPEGLLAFGKVMGWKK